MWGRLTAILIMTILLLTACSPQKNQLYEQTAGTPVETAIISEEQIIDTADNNEVTETKDTTEEEATEVIPEEEHTESETKVNPLTATTVETITVLNADFNNDTNGFMPRGGTNISVVNTDVYEGEQCLQITGRSETWTGALVDMTDIMLDGKHFSLTAWVKYNEGFDTIPISAMLERNGNEYLSIGTVVAKKGEWTKIEGDIVIPEGTKNASVYFETQWKPKFEKEDLCDLYIDAVEITEDYIISTVEEDSIPALKSIYKDYFTVGSGIEPSDLEVPEIKAIILKHFDTITCGNQMKPDFLLDHSTSISSKEYDTSPAVKFNQSDIIMKFATEHGLKVRGHTLVWHSQTPRWLFTVGYSTEPDAELADRETMLLRLENYIQKVLEYYQTNYPGVITAWDVVNEAIDTSGGNKKGLRTKESLWYQTVGEDYIEKTFEYARKYADPKVKLFYNDYNTFQTATEFHMVNMLTDLKEKGLVDGMGIQSHLRMDTPSLLVFEDTIRKFCKIGLEVQLTELDIYMQAKDEEALLKQGKRYARIGEILQRLSKEGLSITNLTLWGVVDNRSWLNADGPNYPLLFDKYFKPKPAFWGLADPLFFE